MQLFCKETQAHLDMNPHLKERGIDKPDALITPDLWLKNCRSRSGSPTSSLSSRNTPQLNRNEFQAADKPLITVTNIQKLLDDSSHYPQQPVNKRKLMKSRKRRIRLPENDNHNSRPVPENQHYKSETIRPPNVNLNPNQGSHRNFNMMPPITVMVPYPVIIPLPIPVPIPIWDIHKAFCENNNKTMKAASSCSSSAGASSGHSSKSVPVEPEETELERQSIMKPKDFPNNNTETEPENEDLVVEAAVAVEERQMIPKLKITRLQTRRITESSRPLRKRKLVNNEYMRVLSSTKNTETNDLRK